MGLLMDISDYFDNLTGVNYSILYVFLGVAGMMVFDAWMTGGSITGHRRRASPLEDDDDEDDPDPPRNFTLEQLRVFDGTEDENLGTTKPVYFSVNGIVFDVSLGRNFYGPDGPYANFAGRECGVALAKMSFDESDLDDLEGVERLSNYEKQELQNWIDKFTHWRPYPIVGRYVPKSKLPDPNRILTKQDLAMHKGNTPAFVPKKKKEEDGKEKKDDHGAADAQEKDGKETSAISGEPTPEGYAVAPIYICVDDKVFDVSFGGVTFYGEGGPYAKFAGHDASRALATMDLQSSMDNTSTDDLSEKQIKCMRDWAANYENKKRYPIVGRLKK